MLGVVEQKRSGRAGGWCSQERFCESRSAHSATRSRHRDHGQPLIYILSTVESTAQVSLSVYSSLFWNSRGGEPKDRWRLCERNVRRLVRNSVERSERFRPTGRVQSPWSTSVEPSRATNVDLSPLRRQLARLLHRHRRRRLICRFTFLIERLLNASLSRWNFASILLSAIKCRDA